MIPKLRMTMAVLCGGLMTVAAGAEGLSDFTLRTAIPADAVMGVHTRGHDGQAFLNEQMERVWAEVEKVQFDRDLKRMFKALAAQGGQDAESFEQNWQRVMDLAAGVNWGSLAKRELAAGFKMGLPPEYVVLMQPPAEEVQRNFEGLAGILKELVGLNPGQFELVSDEQGETITHRVSLVGTPFPVALTLARVKDTIVIGFGATMVEQSLALLSGGEGESLASTERFRQALAELPAPRDAAFFFDMAKFFLQLRGVIEQGMQMAPLPPPDDPGYQQALEQTKVPGRILDRLDIFDYVASTSATDGMKTTGQSVLVMKAAAQDSGLYKALFGGGKLIEPLKFVPQDAENMSASAGFDLLALYEWIIAILREDIPDGEQVITQIVGLKEQTGYDLREDIIAWIGTRTISFSMPAPTAYQTGEFAWMVGVRDESKATEMVNTLMDMIAQNGGQNVAVEPATIPDTEGFRSLKSPMMGMIGLKAPTIGVHAGWLWLGSSPDIIARALRVAAGQEPNFSDNERFQKEGLPLTADATAISFTDMTRWGDQMSQALSSLAMIQMFVPEIGKNPPLQAMLGMASKLGRVMRKFDFLLSSASVSTFDGRTMTTRTVMNYREPPPPPTKPAPPTGDSETPADEPAEDPTQPGGVE